ncbi:MAG: HAMP domain-containing histidine kinase [Bdellovibrionaceae bacterium]|nr:HAMP domain-containing histidine kinase [Pseudobdellovibrionaceae bacterium]
MVRTWSDVTLGQLKKSSIQVLIGSIGCSSFIYMSLYKSNLPYLDVWFFGYLATSISTYCSLWVMHFFSKKINIPAEAQINIYWFFLAVGWLHWCYISSFAFPSSPPENGVFLAIVIAGIGAGSVSLFLSSPRIMRSAILSLLVPFCVGAYTSSQVYAELLSVIALVYSLILLNSGQQLHDILMNEYLYSMRNEQLVRELEDKSADTVINAKRAMMGDVASGMAHEMNNPLTTILLHLDLLENFKYGATPEGDRFLNIIKNLKTNILRIAHITRQLSYFYKNQEHHTFVNTNLDSILKRALHAKLDAITKKNIHIYFEENPSVSVYCQPEELLQAINNILRNAVDACLLSKEKKKWVRLSTVEQKNDIEVRVSDNGAGVPKDIQEKIMHPFFSTKEVGQGLGLGLSISSSIVRNHNGSIKLDVNAENTTFVIQLPAPPEHQSIA